MPNLGLPDFDKLNEAKATMLRRAYELGVDPKRLAKAFEVPVERIAFLASRGSWERGKPDENAERLSSLSADLAQLAAEHRVAVELPTPAIDEAAHETLKKTGVMYESLLALFMDTVKRARDRTMRVGKGSEAEDVASLIRAGVQLAGGLRESAGIRPGTPSIGEGGSVERTITFINRTDVKVLASNANTSEINVTPE